MYRRLAKNTVINILNMGANIIVGLALTPFLIHSLGDEAYGVWVFLTSLMVLRGSLGLFKLGVQTSLVKYIAEYDAHDDEQRISETTSAALIFYSLVGLVLALVIAGFALFGFSQVVSLIQIHPSQEDTARILLFYLSVQTLFDFPALSAMGVLEGLNRFDVTRGFNVVRLAIFAAGSIVLIRAGLGIFALPLATFAGELARVIGHLTFIRKLMPNLRLTFQISRNVFQDMVTFSTKAFIYGLTNTIYNQMDQLIIAVLLTTTLLTDYDISYRLHALGLALMTLIGPFVIPAASALHANGERIALRQLLLRGTRYTSALAGPVVMIMLVLAKPLTVAWVGSDYIHTVPATRLFAGYLLYWMLLRIGQNMLIGMNRLEAILPIYVGSTFVNLVVSFIAAPRLGVQGVILGTVVGSGLAVIPYLLIFQREFDIRMVDLLREVVLRVYPQATAGAAACATLSALHAPSSIIEVGLYGAAGLLVFAVLFVLTGMPPDERIIIKQTLQRFQASRMQP